MKNLIIAGCIAMLSITFANAQKVTVEKGEKDKQEKLQVRLKEGAKPTIYVDGKKFDFSMELIDKDAIESVTVVKGEKAKKEYNADNGVVLIKTKEKSKSDKSKEKIVIKGNASSSGKSPLIVINGEVSNQESLEKLSPDAIDKIEVLKDEKAIKKYNAPNGAVIITTKGN